MSLIQSPQNKNFLSPTGFVLTLTRLPATVYMCNAVQLPSVLLQEIKVPNPMVTLNISTTNIQYGTFSASFMIDEDLQNYREIYQWILDLSVDRINSQYDNILVKKLRDPNAGPRSDATVSILSSSKHPNIQFNFIDVFPSTLTPLPFDTRNKDIEYLTCTIGFSFREFNVTNIDG